MLELVGCAMLFVGLFFVSIIYCYCQNYISSFFQQHCDFLLYYLITHALCILFATIYNFIWISRCIFCFYAAILSSAGIGLSPSITTVTFQYISSPSLSTVINIYCWFIIYLFYRQCRWEQSPDYDLKILPPKKEKRHRQRTNSKE